VCFGIASVCLLASQASSAPATPPGNPRTQLEEKVEKLEQDALVQKQRLQDIREFATAFGIFGSALLAWLSIVSWYRNRRHWETYQRERDFYEKRQSEEQKDFRRDRVFRERIESRQARLELQLGTKTLASFDEMLGAQIRNISGLGQVIDIVTKNAKISLDREEGHAKIEKMVEELRKAAEGRYRRAEEDALRFKDMTAMRWPSLPAERRTVAIEALRGYKTVDPWMVDEMREKRPLDHARLLHFLGIFSYYADQNVEAALAYLADANSLFAKSDVTSEFERPHAYARHFLGVLQKNWPLQDEPASINLGRAQESLRAAERYLAIEGGHFLTALTHAEVLSYLEHEQSAARHKVDAIIDKYDKLRAGGQANDLQKALMPRVYLLRGNLSQVAGRIPEAQADFQKAAELNPESPYGWLSLAQAGGDSPESRPHWEKGLDLLPRPPALDKPETLTRVMIFAWGIVAAHHLETPDLLGDYRKHFETIGFGLEITSKYKPHFFSPLTKGLVDFDGLKKQLDELLSRPIPEVAAKGNKAAPGVKPEGGRRVRSTS
jgi:tetratricopeptide (TPR) repeat protein